MAIDQLLQAIPLDQLLIQTINGIVAGMILALVASGLTLIFGIMDVVNFAHGELFMLGAYVGVIILAATGNFWLALLAASLVVALLGAAIHVTVLRPLLGGEPRAVRAPGRRQSRHGARLGAQSLHRRRGRRHGQPRRVDRRLDLHQPTGILRLALGEPGPGGDLLVRRADPHASVPPHGPVRSDAQMSARRAAVYWTVFAVVLALLIVAPLVLPEFWRRFLTEILIWGLLAMSSDILIGYAGMVSFGHSAFFGLGIYGAAAALLAVRPPNLCLPLLFGP